MGSRITIDGFGNYVWSRQSFWPTRSRILWATFKSRLLSAKNCFYTRLLKYFFNNMNILYLNIKICMFCSSGAGRLVSLCADNSLHLWEINESSLVEVRTLFLEGKLKRISAMCVESTGAKLLLGTEGGNIYPLDLVTFTTTDDIIYQDVVMQQ